MNRTDRFDEIVSDWLHADAEYQVPQHLDAVLRRTSTERQRPAWSSLERWLPMYATLRLSPVPRRAVLLVVLALAVAAIGGVILVAGSLPRHADPFGLTRNGPIVYGATDGDIHAIDPVTQRSTAIITSPDFDFAPSFAPDGSRLIFVRAEQRSGPFVLMLAGADGSSPRALSKALTALSWFAWSPDGSRLAVISDLDGEPMLWTLGLDGTVVRLLDAAMTAENVEWRRDGQELVFRGVRSGAAGPTYGLYRIGKDGTALRPILPPTNSSDHWNHPAVSPDGTRIVYTQWDADIGGRLWMVDIDGGMARRLEFDGPQASDYFATWSPDGDKLVFHRWRGETYHLAVASSEGGRAVEIGPAKPHSSGGASAEFTPDGSMVIARYDPDGEAWLMGIADGFVERLPTTDFVGTMQRLPD